MVCLPCCCRSYVFEIGLAANFILLLEENLRENYLLYISTEIARSYSSSFLLDAFVLSPYFASTQQFPSYLLCSHYYQTFFFLLHREVCAFHPFFPFLFLPASPSFFNNVYHTVSERNQTRLLSSAFQHFAKRGMQFSDP